MYHSRLKRDFREPLAQAGEGLHVTADEHFSEAAGDDGIGLLAQPDVQ